MSPANPTVKTYAALHQAFDFFNDRLFGGELPACLVTLQRKNKAYGVTTRKWRICPAFKNVSGTQVGLTVDVVAFSALRAS